MFFKKTPINEEKELDKYTDKAIPEDIKKIDKKINNMNKGALKDIWCKIEALYKLIKSDEEWRNKAIAIGALIYVISPIDAIPDFIPIAGLLDDVGIVTLAIATLNDAIKKYLDEDCK
jgi:uncharacterized membrane protein YkvA (DUF1232 family)